MRRDATERMPHPARPTPRSGCSSARPPTGSPGARTAPSARCRARASADARRARPRSWDRRTTPPGSSRTMSRSWSVRWIAGSMSTSRRVHAGSAAAVDGRRARRASGRRRGPTRRPASGTRRGEVGGVRVDRVVERARRGAVSAQVDGIRSPAGIREGDAVPPHQGGVRAEAVDEQRAAGRGGRAPREAGERDGCGHPLSLRAAPGPQHPGE